jgi:hypothetical protein
MYDSFKRGSLLLLAYLFKLINQQWPEASNTWYNARDPFGIRVDQSDRSSTLTKWAINICGGYGFVWFSKISLLSLTAVTVIFHACFRQAFGIITEQLCSDMMRPPAVILLSDKLALPSLILFDTLPSLVPNSILVCTLVPPFESLSCSSIDSHVFLPSWMCFSSVR